MKISVIIPVFNDPRVEIALNSILSQVACELEVILIDGGSNWETLQVLSKYRQRIDVLRSEPDRGVFDAINKGIALASGDVIGIIGADDRFNDSRVLGRVTEMLESQAIDGCYGDMVYVNNDDRVIRYWRTGEYSRTHLYLGWSIPHFTLFLRKSIYDRYGGYSIKYPFSSDYDFILRLLLIHHINLGYIHEILLRMTLGGVSNRSTRNIVKANLDALRSWKDNNQHLGFLVPVLKPLRKLPQFISALVLRDS